uniref:NADH-ubiquinone oxidoreductase chain 3 n=1 Tax=Platygaster sp. ZJUH_2016029 TaxID=2496284 RepID=A0A3Q8UAA8_9HYME|nr:NADH dehydrogenase subunit 3 [Platygaster sp. ZJUH_2016029]
MYIVIIFMVGIMIIPFFMLLLNLIIKKFDLIMREKNSCFECGFNSVIKFRLPFSIQFFFISILFLIFDVEMILLFPLLKMVNLNSLMVWLFSSMFIFFILLLGFYLEWLSNLIKWFN